MIVTGTVTVPHEAAAAAAWVHGRAAERASIPHAHMPGDPDPDLDELLDDLSVAYRSSEAPVSVDPVVPDAAESSRRVRGVTLDDVLQSLRDVWALDDEPTRYPVLFELPAVGEP